MLSILMRCKWDDEIYNRASSLYNLIDIHSKAVASIVNEAEPLEAHLIQVPKWKESFIGLNGKKQIRYEDSTCFHPGQSSVQKCDNSSHSETKIVFERASHSNEELGNSSEKGLASFSIDASDLANLLTTDRHIGFNCCAQVLLRSVLAEKQALCFSVISLLWHKLISAPETQPSMESTSAQQGWRQVSLYSFLLL